MQIAPNLQTDRLNLRPLSIRDYPFFWRLAGNAQVRQYLGGPVPRLQRHAQFRRYRQGHPLVGIWVVTRHNQRRAIGLVVLNPHQDGTNHELSYTFHPQYWGNGFAQNATGRVVRHAFEDLHLKDLVAETQSANLASCRMLERLGFRQECRLERFGAEQVIYRISSTPL